jgi:hypothetical protein
VILGHHTGVQGERRDIWDIKRGSGLPWSYDELFGHRDPVRPCGVYNKILGHHGRVQGLTAWGVHVLELIGHHGGVQGLTLMHRDQLGHYGRVQAWREVRGVGLGQHG